MRTAQHEIQKIIPSDFEDTLIYSERNDKEIKATQPDLYGKNMTGKAGTFSWKIEKSDEDLINLNEAKFSVNGYIGFTEEEETQKELEVDTNKLSWNNHWLLGLMNSLEVLINGKTLEKQSHPAILSNIKTSLEQDFNIVNSQALSRFGIQNNQSRVFQRSVVVPEIPAVVDGEGKEVKPAVQASAYLSDETTLHGNRDYSTVIPYIKGKLTKQGIPFSCDIRFKDVFNNLPYKPIFNQEVVIIMEREPSNIIPVTYHGEGIGPLVVREFKKFDLIVPHYKLAPGPRSHLKQVYSNSVTQEIPFAQCKTLLMQTIDQAGINHLEVTLETDRPKFISLFLPKHPSNDFNSLLTNDFNDDDEIEPGENCDDDGEDCERLCQFSRGVNRTSPFASRYVPMMEITVKVNEKTIYKNNKYKSEMALPGFLPKNAMEREMAYKEGFYLDESDAYEKYLKCKEMFFDDTQPLSYHDFITKAFAIHIPTQCFDLRQGDRISIWIRLASYCDVRNPFENGNGISVRHMVLFARGTNTLTLGNETKIRPENRHYC